MADISSNTDRGSGNRHSKPRTKKHSLRVDMTPMVDLAFLLISFFMLTIVISDPRQMDLTMPNGETNAPVGECQMMNVIVDSADRIYTYEGLDIAGMKETSFDATKGIRQVIMAKAKQVRTLCPAQTNGKPREMMCIIKLLPGARYNSMISIVDEMEITGTKVYTIQDPLPVELDELHKRSLLAQNEH